MHVAKRLRSHRSPKVLIATSLEASFSDGNVAAAEGSEVELTANIVEASSEVKAVFDGISTRHVQNW